MAKSPSDGGNGYKACALSGTCFPWRVASLREHGKIQVRGGHGAIATFKDSEEEHEKLGGNHHQLLRFELVGRVGRPDPWSEFCSVGRASEPRGSSANGA